MVQWAVEEDGTFIEHRVQFKSAAAVTTAVEDGEGDNRKPVGIFALEIKGKDKC